MRRGDFAAAWAVSDAVLAARDPATRDDPRLPYHRRWVWDGRPFGGRHVLVRCYHGLGDTLQFVRLLPLLREQARSVLLEAQPELVPVLLGIPGPDRLIPFRLDAPHPPAECDLEIMELGHALRIAPAALSGCVPYLSAAPAAIAAARARIGNAGLNVGLCWAAGDWDRERSIPLWLAAQYLRIPGIRFVCLQQGPARAEAMASWAPRFANSECCAGDVLGTAALIAALDLVVTVDTMVAHLAGALGRPAWLLLKAEADWRWMRERTDSPWYPSLRLYRQSIAGDWRDPLARLAADLAVLARSRRSNRACR